MAPSTADATANDLEHDDLELLHVLVLFRHGDRTPITRVVSAGMAMDARETSFWISRMPEVAVLSALSSGAHVADFDARYLSRSGSKREPPCLTPPQVAHHGGRWPCGQLTLQGVHMMRAKGRALRERYAGFLQDVHPRRDVHVQSTNIRRTIRSAQSVLAGMFPERFSGFDDCEQHGNNWKEGADDDSFVVLADDSNALAPQHSYELYRDLGELLAFEMKHNAPINVPATAKRIREIVGARPEDKRIAWTGLREVLICRRAHGLPAPEGLTDELFRQICDFDAWLWFTLYGKRKFCAVSFRKGVERVYAHLQAVVDGTLSCKLSLFSGHDNSLVALLCALELSAPRVIPPYGAMLTFELYRSRSSHGVFIRPLFEGEEVRFADQPQAALCPFSVFEAAALRFINHVDDASL